MSMEENRNWALKAMGITAAVGVIGYISYKILNKTNHPPTPTPTHKTTPVKARKESKIQPNTTTVSVPIASNQISLDINYWKLYESTIDGIRFKYPPQFSDPKVSKIDFVQAKIISFEYEGYPSFIHLSVEEKMTDSVNDYVEGFLQMLQPSFGFKIIDRQSKSVAGRRAIEVEVEARQPNSSQLLRIWFLFFDGDRLVYHFRYQKKNGQEHLFEVVKTMISSLEILPVPYMGTVEYFGQMLRLEIRLPYIYMCPRYNSEDDFILLDAVSTQQHPVMGLKVTSKLKREYTATLDAFVKHRKSELQNSFSNLKDIQLELLQFNHSYVSITYEDLVQDKICQFIEVLFLFEDYTIIATGYCESRQFASFKQDLIQSLNTLQLSPGEKRETSYSVYKNTVYGFSIQFDVGCELIEHLGTNPVLSLISLEGGELSEDGEEEVKFNQTGVSILDRPASVTNLNELKDYLKGEVEKLDQFGQLNLQVKSESIQKWNNLEAVLLLHSRKDPQTSRSMTFIDTTIMKENKLYTISSYTFSHMYTIDVELLLKQRHESFSFL